MAHSALRTIPIEKLTQRYRRAKTTLPDNPVEATRVKHEQATLRQEIARRDAWESVTPNEEGGD